MPRPSTRSYTPARSMTFVKSVCKISRKNLASGQTQQNFGFIQAAKGKRSGEVRRKGSVEEAAPWEAEGISRATWYYRQAGQHAGLPGRGAPWEAEGISRATWYRRGNRLR